MNYNKGKIKEQLTHDMIFQLLEEFHGNPIWHSSCIISQTICHNAEGGSYKLYFYFNSQLFRCFSGCEEPNFDIFDLVIKVAHLQWHKEMDLNDAVRWVAGYFGLQGTIASPDLPQTEDWRILENYERISEITSKNITIPELEEYDSAILNRLNYNIKIAPWIKEGITQDVLDFAVIGYYPGADQITIPHFDQKGRFIGLRGRAMAEEEITRYGKYRPVRINSITYKHPLGMNLYGLNWNQKQIKLMEKAIVFESEKAVLQYASYFGWENNISVACCGSNVSAFQIQMLIDAGAKEIVVGLDRQFVEIGDEEFKKLKANLLRLRERYKNYITMSFIFDKGMITGYKDAPTDAGAEIFLQLFKERIVL